MDTRTQGRLRELIAALASNPNLPNLVGGTTQIAPANQPHTGAADPPPYPFVEEDDGSDIDEDDVRAPHPMNKPSTKINIDASTHVIGSHNSLTVNAPNALAAMVFAALRQASQASVAVIDGTVTSRSVTLRLNCNVDVRGDGNVVGGSGGVGLGGKKPEAGANASTDAASATPAMPEPVAGRGPESGGRKRAAEEVRTTPFPSASDCWKR